jgi:hypothetical protein
MQAIDLLAEMFYGATVRVVPRPIVTPGLQAGLRRGHLGKVEGLVIGEPSGRPVVLFECSNATMEVEMATEGAVEAVKALAGLPCQFPERLRRQDISREKVTAKDSRDGADLGLLAKMGGGGVRRSRDES